MKARIKTEVFCPECGWVYLNEIDSKTMSCVNQGCKLFKQRFMLPTIEIEIEPTPEDE